MELPAKDVGAALQLLEFCNAFSEVLDIKKGQPESILRNLTSGRVKRYGVCLTPAEFNIKLLSLMEKDVKKEELQNWIEDVASKFDEGRKVLAAEKKEKLLKQKAKDETAKAIL